MTDNYLVLNFFYIDLSLLVSEDVTSVDEGNLKIVRLLETLDNFKQPSSIAATSHSPTKKGQLKKSALYPCWSYLIKYAYSLYIYHL